MPLLCLNSSGANGAPAHHNLRKMRRMLLPIGCATSQNPVRNQQPTVSLRRIDELLVGMPMTPSNRLTKLALSNSGRAEPAKIWKARSYIQDHLEEELSLKVVAKFVAISPN